MLLTFQCSSQRLVEVSAPLPKRTLTEALTLNLAGTNVDIHEGGDDSSEGAYVLCSLGCTVLAEHMPGRGESPQAGGGGNRDGALRNAFLRLRSPRAMLRKRSAA